MNRPAGILVGVARKLVERWRQDAFEGDLSEVNGHIEMMEAALGQLGSTPEEAGAAFVSVHDVLTMFGLAIVGSLEGIRAELIRKRTGGQPTEDVRERQYAFDLLIRTLAKVAAKHVEANR